MDLSELGQRIQQARHDRDLTLQELADLSSVSVSMLSSVERGDKAPTVIVLDRIANGLGVRLANLVDPGAADSVIVRRAAEQDVVEEPDGWSRTIVTPVVPGVNFEWIRSTLPPGCEPPSYAPYAHGSHEFIYVTKGTVTLIVDDRTIELKAGDSIYLAGDVTLTYANRGKSPCTYFVAAMVMRPRDPGMRWRRELS